MNWEHSQKLFSALRLDLFLEEFFEKFAFNFKFHKWNKELKCKLFMSYLVKLNTTWTKQWRMHFIFKMTFLPFLKVAYILHSVRIVFCWKTMLVKQFPLIFIFIIFNCLARQVDFYKGAVILGFLSLKVYEQFIHLLTIFFFCTDNGSTDFNDTDRTTSYQCRTVGTPIYYALKNYFDRYYYRWSLICM